MEIPQYQESLLFHILPDALRQAFIADNVRFASIMQEVIMSAAQSEEMDGAITAEAMSCHASQLVISALKPMALSSMQNMSESNRLQTMEFLSNPEPITRAMRETLSVLLNDGEAARQAAQTAFELSAGVPEVQAMLGSVDPRTIVCEIRGLLEDGEAAASDGPRAASQETRAHARHIAEVAAATAHSAQRLVFATTSATNASPFSGMGAVAGASTPLLSTPSTPLHVRRRSGRLAMTRHIDPLLVLDPDSLHVALQLLSAPDFNVLQQLSKQWRSTVRTMVQGRAWLQAYGALDAVTPIKILSESGVARLQVSALCPAETRDKWTVLRFVRRDGPSVGPISRHHIVSIVHSRDGAGGGRATGGRPQYFSLVHSGDPQLPGVDSEFSCLQLRPDRTPEAAAAAHTHAPCVLCYEEEYGLFSADGKYRFGFAVSARDKDHWSCKLKIWPLSSDCPVPSATTRHANASCRT